LFVVACHLKTSGFLPVCHNFTLCKLFVTSGLLIFVCQGLLNPSNRYFYDRIDVEIPLFYRRVAPGIKIVRNDPAPPLFLKQPDLIHLDRHVPVCRASPRLLRPFFIIEISVDPQDSPVNIALLDGHVVILL
jgi:prepilin-type processing-associated H-X9-DG protein